METILGISGVALIVVVGFIYGAFYVGKKYSKATLENKGHEEVEKHLIRQADQNNRLTAKYVAARNLLRKSKAASDQPAKAVKAGGGKGNNKRH